jgi:hypothetical protein
MSYKQLRVVTPGNCCSVENCLLRDSGEIGRNKNTVQPHFQTGVRFRHLVSASITPLTAIAEKYKIRTPESHSSPRRCD